LGEVSALWVTDSGASHKFCNDLSSFQNSIPIKLGIGLGDHNTVYASRAGLVVLCNSHSFLHFNSIYVPQFCMSLLSVGQLTFKDWQVNFSYDICRIINSQGQLCATVIAKSSIDIFVVQMFSNALVTTRSVGGIDVPSKVFSTSSMIDSPILDFHLDSSTPVSVDSSTPVSADYANITAAPIDILTLSVGIPHVQNNANPNISNLRNQRQFNNLNLWQRRFAHLYSTALRRAIQSAGNEHSPTFTDEPPKFCEICVRSKYQQVFTQTSIPRSTLSFKLVHSDLCGPFTTLTLGGASYYIIYIDDCTR
jgi:hypothetical protein